MMHVSHVAILKKNKKPGIVLSNILTNLTAHSIESPVRLFPPE